jgi:uncharacterized surface protein with fasciclin (FAS1) repeats
MSDHPLDLLPFYASGLLSNDAIYRIESHLAECDSCRRALSEWQILADAVQKRAEKRAASLPPLRLPVEAHSVKGEKAMSTSFMSPRHRLPNRLLAVVTAVFALVLLSMLFLPLPRVSETPLVNTQAERRTIYDILQSDPQFSALVKAIDANAWLKSVLQGDGPVTFFTMPDNVFKPVLLWVNSRKQAGEPDWTQEVIFDHLLRGAWSSSDLVRMGKISSDWVQGATAYVTVITATQSAAQKEITLNDRAHFITANIPASNGLIHIIDRSLIPDFMLSPPPIGMTSADNLSIYDYLKQDGRFTLLMDIIDRSGYAAGALKRSEHNIQTSLEVMTLFAPTDEAMRAWLKGKDIKELGTYLPDAFIASHLLQGQWSKNMLEARVRQHEPPQIRISTDTAGRSILLALAFDGLLLNDGARILQPDIITSNGIIHVIDKVLVGENFPD